MREYPTDEELALFIAKMEQQELYAPAHLKEEILKQAFPEQTVEALPKPGGGEKGFQFFAYRLKIIAGMAAALVMLALLPSLGAQNGYGMGRAAESGNMQEREMAQDKDGEQDDGQDEVNVNYLLNESMRRTNERLNSLIGQINIFK